MLCNSPQAVSDLDRGWTVGPKEAHSKLADLKQKGAKQEVRQYLYWCVTFSPHITPESQTKVMRIMEMIDNYRLKLLIIKLILLVSTLGNL